ncbi:MAG: zinc ABC transporter substrate-binding protein [Chlamydiota bacterium]
MLLFYFFLCSFFTSCQPSESTDKPVILVSIPPYAWLAQEIVGKEARVETIVPEGVDVHTYEPTARSLARYQQADIWFRIGDPFEEKILPVLKEANPDLEVYDLRETVPLLYTEDVCCHGEHNHNHLVDVHTWMSPKLALQQALFMQTILEATYKNGQFAENAFVLQTCLTKLDAKIRALLEHAPSRAFLTSHPSFAYFCEEYGLQQISLERKGKEPLAKGMQASAEAAERAGVAVALIEPQFSPKSAKIVAKSLDIPVQMVDPCSKNYPESVLRLAKILNDPESP